MIPTVPGSEMVSTPTTGVKLDVGALEAPLRAKMKLAQAQGGLASAIGEVGQVVGDFGAKLQQAKNFGIAADSDRQMRQAWEDFHSSLPGRTDEENWSKDWQAKAQAVKDSVYSQHKPAPDLKAQLDNNFANWQQSTAIEAKTVANKQTINRAVERADLSADAAAMAGDEVGIRNALEPLARLGAATPEKVNAMVAQKMNKRDEYAAKNYIMAHAGNAVDFITETEAGGTDENPKHSNFPLLTADQRNTLKVAAEQAQSKFWNGNLDMARIQVDRGDEVSEDYLQEKLKNKELGERQVIAIRTYKKNVANQITPDDRKAAGEDVNAMIARVNSGNSPEERTKAINGIYSSLQWQHLNANQRALFSKEIKTEIDPVKNPAIAEQRANDNKLRSDGLFYPSYESTITKKNRFFPDVTTTEKGRVYSKAEVEKMDQAELEKRFGKGVSISDVLTAEDIAFGKYRTAMRDYEAKNPDATAADLATYSAGLRKPYLINQIQKEMGVVPVAPVSQATVKPAPDKTSDTVRVKSPDGKIGNIPKANLEKAKAAGYTEL